MWQDRERNADGSFCVIREKQRERDRERDKDRDRQKQTETDRDRQRQTETDRDRQTDIIKTGKRREKDDSHSNFCPCSVLLA